MDKMLFKNDWLEVTKSFGLAYKFRKAGYFDERPSLQFYLTPLLSVIVMAPVGLMYGLPWWYWVVTLGVFLFGYIQVFLKLPFHTGIVEFEPPVWGIYYYSRALWICKGRDTSPHYMPWDMKHYRRSILKEDGDWLHIYARERSDYTMGELEEIRWEEEHPYFYKLKNGEVQETIVSIHVEEREWRWRMFYKVSIPWFRKIKKVVEVSFHDAIGEGVNTFKGGVVGTGEEMLDGEEPFDTLKRMEANREFRR